MKWVIGMLCDEAGSTYENSRKAITAAIHWFRRLRLGWIDERWVVRTTFLGAANAIALASILTSIITSSFKS
jgi:hypothetical protein